MELEYNSARPDLVLPEYGRNVKKMVNFAMTVEDKEERNKVVGAIIKIMGQLNPHLRDVDDYNHKLWDHIFIMSNFELDVDSPYPIPTKETFNTKPDKVSYPSGKIKYGHYGKVIEDLIKTIPDEKDETKQKDMIDGTLNLMKRFYLTWNRDAVEDEVLVKQLNELSGGLLNVKEEDVKIGEHKDVQLRSKVERTQNRKNQKSGRKSGGSRFQKKGGRRR